jgi:hypothetical protein
MTPLRNREMIQADIVGLEASLASAPDDPLAKPLAESRVAELREELSKAEKSPSIIPETELFFGQGPVVGAKGIEAKFAGQVLDRFQDMVTNHFAAKFHGVLRRAGRRRGEADSKLFLTALPRGSFGLQLSQPHVQDFVTANQLATVMEDVTTLIGAAGKDDQSFDDTLSSVHGRVLIPLKGFLETLTNSGVDCRIISGMKQAILKKEQVSQAYQRVAAAKTEEEPLELDGTFFGALVKTGRFDFEPKGQDIISGWLADEVTEEQAINMDQLTGKPARAKMHVTIITTKTGKRRPTYELQSLNSLPLA